MYLQNNFMQNSPLGYNKNELITVNIERINNRDAFINQLKAYHGIEDVTYSDWLLSSADQYNGWLLKYEGEDINFTGLRVDYTFLRVMGIEITEGRDFRAGDAYMQHGMFVFNETARKKFGMETGTRLEGWISGEVIGFMSDVKFASFREEVFPMAFFVRGTGISNHVYIRLNAGVDKRAAMSHINASLAQFDSNNTYNVRFYDEVLQRLYEKEISLNSLITLFSLLAIFISIVGVFGLVVFDSECRRKEIGIRKIFGASTIGIIIMFNKSYFKILMICLVIAAPFAWYAVNRWLENFAYKTPMYWWVYLLAFMVVGVIMVCTITFQTWRVANDDPVKAIKTE
jgi:putative ABC transport system permease protein